MEQAQIVADTRKWVENIVAGLNLCPFSPPVLRADTIRFAVSPAKAPSRLMKELLKEINHLLETSAEEVQTTLLITPYVLNDFEDFLDFVAEAEALMEENNITEEFQLATFHPDYYFDDVPKEDPANFTNRSPYPMLHLLREASLSEALQNYPNPEDIPERNIALLREMGTAKITALLGGMNHPAAAE